MIFAWIGFAALVLALAALLGWLFGPGTAVAVALGGMLALIASLASLYKAGGGRFRHASKRPTWNWTLEAPFCAAHRGGAGLQPENTLAAFDTAVREYGCRFLELDVHATADGIPVVIHDPTVDRTTDGTGAVRSFTLAELLRLDAAHRFGPHPGAPAVATPRPCAIPTLEDVLRRYPECWISIDVKQEAPPCEAAVVEVIRRCDAAGRVLVGSDAHARFRRIQTAGPELASFFSQRSAILYLVAYWLGVLRWYRPSHHTLQIPEGIGPLRVVSPRFVRAAHRLGIPVIVWTVNEPDDMRRLLAMGVDGVMTDRPDVFNRIKAEFEGPKRALASRA